MNKREKEIQQVHLNNEKAVLKKLEANYKDALGEINSKIEILMARQDADMQHVIYQVEYQKALKTQVQAILETLQTNEFETLSEYLTKSYEDGFIGTMYNLQGQGIPLVFPIDQEQVVAAIQHETKLSENLYTALGKDVVDLRKKIAGEISRGISSGQMYNEIARNIAGWAMIPKNNAMRIARTEAHRIQCKASMNACNKAKEKGADVVKQWDSSLDGKTRATHRELDGQIRELDEPFEVAGMKAMQPGDFNRPEEDINCRCALLQRARWALGNDYTKWSPDAPVVIDDDGTTQFTIIEAKNYEDFQKKYKQATERVREDVQMMKPVNKYGEEIQFNWKGGNEAHEQQKQILSKLSNEYDTRLQKVTGGAKGSAGDVDISGATMRLNDVYESTAIHEFFHTLSSTDATKYGLTNDQEFWKEIRKIRTAYRKDVGDDTKRFISGYEHSNKALDEFAAEAFTQAKMAELGLELPSKYGSDLTYSKQVLEVVDKHFGKKPLENLGKIHKSVGAKTIKEAEEYAQQFVSDLKTKYSGNVSYKGMDIEFANKVNNVIAETYSKYDCGKLGNIKPINFREKRFKNSTSDAAYEWGEGTLYFNGHYFADTKALASHNEEADGLLQNVLKNANILLDKPSISESQKYYIETLVKTGRQCVAQSHDFVEATFTHEMGHMLDDKLFGLQKVQNHDFLEKSMREYAGNISGYAIKSSAEYVAESYTAYRFGEIDILDPKLVEIFKGAEK